jgi:hypothetical protein
VHIVKPMHTCFFLRYLALSKNQCIRDYPSECHEKENHRAYEGENNRDYREPIREAKPLAKRQDKNESGREASE